MAIRIVLRQQKRINNSLYFYLFINFILSWISRTVTSELKWRAVALPSVYCCCQKKFNEILFSGGEHRSFAKSFLPKIETKVSSLWLQKVIQNNPLRRNRQLSYDGRQLWGRMYVCKCESGRTEKLLGWLNLVCCWIKYFHWNFMQFAPFFNSRNTLLRWRCPYKRKPKIKFSSINKLSLLACIKPTIDLFWKMHSIRCEISKFFFLSHITTRLTVLGLGTFATKCQLILNEFG